MSLAQLRTLLKSPTESDSGDTKCKGECTAVPRSVPRPVLSLQHCPWLTPLRGPLQGSDSQLLFSQLSTLAAWKVFFVISTQGPWERTQTCLGHILGQGLLPPHPPHPSLGPGGGWCGRFSGSPTPRLVVPLPTGPASKNLPLAGLSGIPGMRMCSAGQEKVTGAGRGSVKSCLPEFSLAAGVSSRLYWGRGKGEGVLPLLCFLPSFPSLAKGQERIPGDLSLTTGKHPFPQCTTEESQAVPCAEHLNV